MKAPLSPFTGFSCPRCGWTHADYRATGHFRCATCLESALGSGIHSETPCAIESRGHPTRLQADLRIGIQLAVKDENYELAAILRDTLGFLHRHLLELPFGI